MKVAVRYTGAAGQTLEASLILHHGQCFVRTASCSERCRVASGLRSVFTGWIWAILFLSGTSILALLTVTRDPPGPPSN